MSNLAEIFLGIIASCLGLLIVTLVVVSIKLYKAFGFLKTDLQKISNDTSHLIHTVNEFVETDLNKISKDASHLIETLTDLSDDLAEKSHSLNLLFKPLSFLTSKFTSDSPSEKKSPKSDTIPLLLKWIGSSASLFKSTKEFIKK